jgi:diguanylate cyclase (GGDEF)-like protein/PAS domain S-box-containing protein
LNKKRFHAAFGEFQVDSEAGVIHEGLGSLGCQPKELAAFCLLMEHAGKVVSKEQLIAEVWHGQVVSDGSIARCISSLKSRLRRASPGAESCIKSEYGRGYRFQGCLTAPSVFGTKESFLTIINASPDFIAIKDGEGRWQVLNQAGVDFYGLETLVWQGRTDLELADMVQPCFRESLLACSLSDESAWVAGAPQLSNESIQLGDGSTLVFEVLKTPVFDMQGRRHSMVIYGREETVKTRSLEQARLFSQVLSNSSEAVVITDAKNNIVLVNHAFESITGYSAKEVIGKNPRILSSGRHTKEFYSAIWKQLEFEGIWRGEIWDRRKNGEIYPKWLDISKVCDRNGKITHYIGIFSDISDRKAIEAQLEFLAYHDPLTRLPNRLLLRDRFSQACHAATRDGSWVAMLFLDLDQFKTINDTLGHVMGDQLLLSVVERLKKCVRDTDTISRLGGDEFVVLLTGVIDLGVVSVVAQKILDHLEEPFEIHGHRLMTSFSIGIGICPDDGDDFDTLLKVADTAMYYAKDSGRNAYRFYTEQMNIQAMERLHILNDLHQALKNDEFVLHYQPQLDLNSGKVIGLEALIRWNSPGSGMVLPGKFIPVAEENGLIVQIGEWVLREVCRQQRIWQDAGYEPLVVAVNLSAIQFRRGDIVDKVIDILRQSGVGPEWLELELTESILIQDVERTLGMVEQLKSTNIGLSIDDFGTGYSSLAYLKRFKVDKLKIDQSFIRNLEVDRDDAAIVRSIIQLAHGLDLRVIAEGVESDKQLAILRNYGCDEVQGYFYSHPLPPDKLVKFLKRRKALALDVQSGK